MKDQPSFELKTVPEFSVREVSVENHLKLVTKYSHFNTALTITRFKPKRKYFRNRDEYAKITEYKFTRSRKLRGKNNVGHHTTKNESHRRFSSNSDNQKQNGRKFRKNIYTIKRQTGSFTLETGKKITGLAILPMKR